ncbi:MAG: tetratricopeptide repeat protein [Gammaproteobacteria bacterium]|nr:tetratricopeptide repeat protein [Gammaproteobacteria bacterium]
MGSSFRIATFFERGEPLDKLTGSLLFISLLMFSHAEAVLGATGTKLKSHNDSPSDMAALHYRRGLKAANKAVKYQTGATASSTDKKKSMLRKAEKQYQKAITLYKRALRVMPSLQGVRTDLGFALVQIGRFEEAVAILEEAISRNKYNEKASAYHTEALMKFEQLTGASE